MNDPSHRSILPALVLGAWLVGPSSVPAAVGEVPTQELVKRVAPSVVSIEVFDKAGDPRGHGTGFLIGRDTVLTNEHVVSKGFSLKILSGPSQKVVDAEPELLKTDPEADLALLKVHATDLPALEIDPRVSAEPGQPVVAYGNLYEDQLLVSEGIVRARLSGQLVISAAIHGGHSGSPLLDGHGRVIGILSSSFDEVENMAFAVDLAAIEKFLKAPATPRRYPPAGTSLLWPRVWKRTTNIAEVLFGSIFAIGKWLFGIYLKIASIIVLPLLAWEGVKRTPVPIKSYLAFAVSVTMLLISVFIGLYVFFEVLGGASLHDVAGFAVALAITLGLFWITLRYRRRHRTQAVGGTRHAPLARPITEEAGSPAP